MGRAGLGGGQDLHAPGVGHDDDPVAVEDDEVAGSDDDAADLDRGVEPRTSFVGPAAETDRGRRDAEFAEPVGAHPGYQSPTLPSE